MSARAPKSIGSCARLRIRASPSWSIPPTRQNSRVCDKVVVLSRGRVVETLTGGDVAEARIVAAAVSADHNHDVSIAWRAEAAARTATPLLQADNTPAVPLAIVLSSSPSTFTLKTRISFRRSTSTTSSCWRPPSASSPWDRHRAPVRWRRPVGGPAGGFSRRGCIVLRERWQAGR